MLSRSPFYPSLFSPFDDVFAGFETDVTAHRHRQLALARARQIEEEQRRRYEVAVNYRAALIRQAYEDEARRRHAAYLAREQRRHEMERALRPATWHLVVEYREPARDEAILAIPPVADAHPSAAKGTSTPPTDGAQQQASANISTEASPPAADAYSKLPAADNTKSVEDVQVPVPDAASISPAPRPAQREIFDLMNAFVADVDKHLAALFPGASASARPSVPETSETSRDAKAVDQDAKSVADKPQDDVRDAFISLFKTVEAIMAEGDKTLRRVHDELNKSIKSEHTQDVGSSSSPQVKGSDEVATATSPTKTEPAAPSASPSASAETADAVNARVDEVIRQAKELGAKVEKLEMQERGIGTKLEGNEGKESAGKEEEVVA